MTSVDASQKLNRQTVRDGNGTHRFELVRRPYGASSVCVASEREILKGVLFP